MLVIEHNEIFISNSTRVKRSALSKKKHLLYERGIRDSQRSRLYAADREFEYSLLVKGEGNDVIRAKPDVSLEGAVGGYVNHIVCLPEFGRLFGKFSVAVEICRSASRSWAQKDKIFIGAKAGLVSRVDVLHEVAHCIVPAGQPPHGKAFASIFLSVIGLAYDSSVLEEMYIKKGVKYEVL
jgi:hypothetical protein